MSTDVLMNMSVPAGAATGSGLGNLGPFGPIGPVTGMNMGNLAFNGFMIGPSHQSIDSGSWVDLLVSAVQAKSILDTPMHGLPETDSITSVRLVTFYIRQVAVYDNRFTFLYAHCRQTLLPDIHWWLY